MAGLVDQAAENAMVVPGERVVHVTHGGESFDVSFAILDIGDASSDEQIKQAAANFYEFPVEKLRGHEVRHEPNGNITLRPQARFG